MKLSTLQLLAASLLFAGMATGCSTPQQYIEGTPQVAHAAAERNFNVSINYVRPQRMSSRYISPGYGVRIKGDSIVSDLPFFGVSHRADFDSESPLRFAAPIDDYSVEPAKRGGTRVKASVRHKQEKLVYDFLLGANGEVTLNVLSVFRDDIGYSGDLTE